MPVSRQLRYAAPNAVTVAGMLCGMLSMMASHEHRFVDAGWWIIWAVLVDRLDGLVARALKATSDFGVQMDSFADAMNFGVAPAFMVWVGLNDSLPLGLNTGPGRWFLLVACGSWALANVVRLAKFNVVPEAPGAGLKVFYGVPTTLAAGILVIWLLVLLKYGPEHGPFAAPEFGGPRLLGDWVARTELWSYVPGAMIVGAMLMVSNVPIPKLQGLRSKFWTAMLLLGVLTGYLCGFARILPEYMALLPSSWLVAALVWSQFSRAARNVIPPRVFPDPGPLRRRAD